MAVQAALLAVLLVQPSAQAAVNHPPVIAPIASKSVQSGTELSFLVDATDADNDTLWIRANNMPAGASFNNVTGEFSWTPNVTQVGTHVVTFQVWDAYQRVSLPVTITVAAGSNRPPVIDPIPNKTDAAGSLLSFTVSATDPEDDVMHAETSNLPAGASFDPRSGEFRWRPAATQAGTVVNVTFKVIDEHLAQAVVTVSITVTASNNHPPVITPIPAQSADVGSRLQFDIEASDTDGDEMTLSASNLPRGARLNRRRGFFAWTPAANQIGSHNVTFEVKDEQGGSSSITVAITVGQSNNHAPVIVAIPDQTVAAGQTLRFDVDASDADDDDMTLAGRNLPRGARLNTRRGTFTWKPTDAQVGQYQVTFEVTDEHGARVSRNVTITVTAAAGNRPPVLIPIGNKSIAAGSNLRFQIDASDADDDTMTLSAARLPEEARLNRRTGVFSWTPESDQVGQHQVTFNVRDEHGAVASETITITVTRAASTALALPARRTLLLGHVRGHSRIIRYGRVALRPAR